MTADPRKQRVRAYFDEAAANRDEWIRKSRYFHDEDIRYLKFLIPAGASVLELGCGSGRNLQQLDIGHGVGIDFSSAMIEQARSNCPHHEFFAGDIEDAATFDGIDGPFDYILIADTIGLLDDCDGTLRLLHRVCGPDTRIIILYYSQLWDPLLRVAELLGLKMPAVDQNWLTTSDIANLLWLANFEVVREELRTLLPFRIPFISAFLNRFVATLPLLRRLCLRNFLVARSREFMTEETPSATVVVPCKNERNNVEQAVIRLPDFCDDLEILFVEGGSADGTMAEIERVIAEYPQRNIRVVAQEGRGKGAAVRTGSLQRRVRY